MKGFRCLFSRVTEQLSVVLKSFKNKSISRGTVQRKETAQKKSLVSKWDGDSIRRRSAVDRFGLLDSPPVDIDSGCCCKGRSLSLGSKLICLGIIYWPEECAYQTEIQNFVGDMWSGSHWLNGNCGNAVGAGDLRTTETLGEQEEQFGLCMSA